MLGQLFGALGVTADEITKGITAVGDSAQKIIPLFGKNPPNVTVGPQGVRVEQPKDNTSLYVGAAIVGVGGYLLYRHFKKKGKR